MSSDLGADVTTTPEYHALFDAFETAQADWDAVRPDSSGRDAEPEEGTAQQRERYDRYRSAVDDLNGYRLSKGLGAF